MAIRQQVLLYQARAVPPEVPAAPPFDPALLPSVSTLVLPRPVRWTLLGVGQLPEVLAAPPFDPALLPRAGALVFPRRPARLDALQDGELPAPPPFDPALLLPPRQALLPARRPPAPPAQAGPLLDAAASSAPLPPSAAPALIRPKAAMQPYAPSPPEVPAPAPLIFPFQGWTPALWPERVFPWRQAAAPVVVPPQPEAWGQGRLRGGGAYALDRPGRGLDERGSQAEWLRSPWLYSPRRRSR